METGGGQDESIETAGFEGGLSESLHRESGDLLRGGARCMTEHLDKGKSETCKLLEEEESALQ